jgi:hypothetical protein
VQATPRFHRFEKPAAAAAAVLFVVVLLAPTFHLGFIFDDAHNAAETGSALSAVGETLGSEIRGDWADWAHVGRFFPLSEYIRVLFWAVDGRLWLYRLGILCLVLANAGLFSLLVRKLTGSGGLAILGFLLAPALFQVRYFHDPIMSYAGLLQAVTFFTFLSLIALLSWLTDRRPYQLALSLAAYGASLLTYEIGLPFFLLHALLIWGFPRTRSFREVVRMAWPFAAMAAGCALVPVLFRLSGNVALSGNASAGAWTPHLQFGAVLTALSKQTLGALPLSYYASRAVGTRLGLTNGFLLGTPAQYLALFPAAVVSLIALAGLVTHVAIRWAASSSSDSHMTPAASPSLVLLLGAGLWILPGALISLSPVRQAELYWGVSYLPVYVSYFGVALVVLGVVQAILRRWPQRTHALIVVLTLCIGGLAALWYGNATTATEVLDREWHYPRSAITDAASARLFQGVAPEAVYVTSGDRFWDIPIFFASLSPNVPARVQHLGAVASGVENLSGDRSTRAGATTIAVQPEQDVYFIDYDGRSDGSGYALVTKIATLTVQPGGGFRIEGQPIAYFRSAPTGQPTWSRKASQLLPAEKPLKTSRQLGLPTTGRSSSTAAGTLIRYSQGQVFDGQWKPTATRR